MRVPTQDNFSVMPDALPQARFNAPNVPDAGRQASAFGAAAQQAGDMAARLADEVNKTIVGEALAKLQDAADRRRLDPETGFASLLGANAMNRPDGKPLTEEYGGYFDEDYHAIAAGLKNGRQREIFAQAAQGVRQGYMRQVSAHMLTQGRKAVGESLESQSVLNLRAFQLASGGEERQQAFERFGVSVDKLAAMNGWTPEKVLAEKQAAFGRAISIVAANSTAANYRGCVAANRARLPTCFPECSTFSAAAPRWGKAVSGRRHNSRLCRNRRRAVVGFYRCGSPNF